MGDGRYDALPSDNIEAAMPRRLALEEAKRLTNEKPHFHAYIASENESAFFRRAHAYRSKNAARQWAMRNYRDREVMVRPCYCERGFRQLERSRST